MLPKQHRTQSKKVEPFKYLDLRLHIHTIPLHHNQNTFPIFGFVSHKLPLRKTPQKTRQKSKPI